MAVLLLVGLATLTSGNQVSLGEFEDIQVLHSFYNVNGRHHRRFSTVSKFEILTSLSQVRGIRSSIGSMLDES